MKIDITWGLSSFEDIAEIYLISKDLQIFMMSIFPISFCLALLMNSIRVDLMPRSYFSVVWLLIVKKGKLHNNGLGNSWVLAILCSFLFFGYPFSLLWFILSAVAFRLKCLVTLKVWCLLKLIVVSLCFTSYLFWIYKIMLELWLKEIFWKAFHADFNFVGWSNWIVAFDG